MSRILVVEDHIGIREAYELLFIKEGYEVVAVENGEQALDATKSQDFKAILLDMMMPEMSGIDFLRNFIPSNHPGTKIIIFSNLEDEEIVKEAMQLGASKYIRKATVPPKEMAKIVAETLAS